MEYDYLILGGGISGISFARMLQLSGCERFLVLEANTEPGGLCRTVTVNEHVVDIGGGHFLCTTFPAVYDFIFAHVAQSEFRCHERVSTVRVEGHEIDYPIESNIWQLPAEVCSEYLISIVRNGESRGDPAPSDFEGWIRWKLGDVVAERYMLPYNRKLWGLPPCEMDIDWLHKIPRLDVTEIVQGCLRRAMDRNKMPSHASFYYPRSGGFQRIFDAILSRVAKNVETGVRAVSLSGAAGNLVVNGRYRAKVVVSTVPWHEIRDSPIFDAAARASISRLRASGIAVQLHERTYSHTAHWTYVPDEGEAHHREFFINNFAPHSRRSGVFTETNIGRATGDKDVLYRHLNGYAYPIPCRGWATAIDGVLRAGERIGLYGLGRWGQWRYFNSDVCIAEAMSLCDRLSVNWRNGLHRQFEHGRGRTKAT